MTPRVRTEVPEAPKARRAGKGRPSTFPYLYDFSLNAWLYYLPDVSNPGRYSHDPRWFFNFATGQWIPP